MEAASRHRRPSKVHTYGFRKGRGPMLITELVRHLLFLSHEWGPRLFIGSYDIRTAFDTMRHQLIFRALVGRGIPEQLAVALVWELCGVSADVSVMGVAEVFGVAINSGGRQGGTETTWCWNIMLEFILEELVETWNDLDMGFTFDGLGLVNHAIWADNIYLFAKSAHEHVAMFQMLSAVLYKNDSKWRSYNTSPAQMWSSLATSTCAYLTESARSCCTKTKWKYWEFCWTDVEEHNAAWTHV